jgi:hypothetical protein
MLVSCSGDYILHHRGEQFLSPAGPQAGCTKRRHNSPDRVYRRPSASAATRSASTPLPKASVNHFKQRDYIRLHRNTHNMHSRDIGAWFVDIIQELMKYLASYKSSEDIIVHNKY